MRWVGSLCCPSNAALAEDVLTSIVRTSTSHNSDIAESYKRAPGNQCSMPIVLRRAGGGRTALLRRCSAVQGNSLPSLQSTVTPLSHFTLHSFGSLCCDRRAQTVLVAILSSDVLVTVLRRCNLLRASVFAISSAVEFESFTLTNMLCCMGRRNARACLHQLLGSFATRCERWRDLALRCLTAALRAIGLVFTHFWHQLYLILYHYQASQTISLPVC